MALTGHADDTQLMSAFGEKADMMKTRRNVRFGSKADIAECDWNVRFVPEADIRCCSVLHKLPHGHFPLGSKAGEDVTLIIGRNFFR